MPIRARGRQNHPTAVGFPQLSPRALRVSANTSPDPLIHIGIIQAAACIRLRYYGEKPCDPDRFLSLKEHAPPGSKCDKGQTQLVQQGYRVPQITVLVGTKAALCG